MTDAITAHALTKTYFPGKGILEALNLSRSPAKQVPALDQVSFTVKEGETFVLLGPNGAGKTTLIKTLSTLILPDSGTASIYGHDLLTEPHQVKKKISLVLGEERSFYWRLTGRQNLEFFAVLYEIPKSEVRKRIHEVMEHFEIASPDTRYQEYSSGTKQRLALARAFLSQASVLFLDEPTRSLDPNAAVKLRSLIKSMTQTAPVKTVFFTTHFIHEAEELADQIGILDQGALKACGTLEDLGRKVNSVQSSLENIYQKIMPTDTSHALT